MFENYFVIFYPLLRSNGPLFLYLPFFAKEYFATSKKIFYPKILWYKIFYPLLGQMGLCFSIYHFLRKNVFPRQKRFSIRPVCWFYSKGRSYTKRPRYPRSPTIGGSKTKNFSIVLTLSLDTTAVVLKLFSLYYITILKNKIVVENKFLRPVNTFEGLLLKKICWVLKKD